MEVRNGWGARGQGVSVASASQAGAQDSYGYNDYGVEEKEVCLQEVNRKDCHVHRVEGCDDDLADSDDEGTGSGCNSDEDSCDCDPVTSFWTSELTCCNDKHDYNYGHGSASVGDHLWGGARGSIGTCDWTMHYVDDDLVPGPGIPISTNIEKLGAANAICYFGVDAQECGGPFCERMVMSLEGYVYGVGTVYTYWGETDTTQPGCDVITFAPNNIRAGARKAPQSTDRKVADNTKAAPAKPAAASSDASAQYYDGGHYEDRNVFSGRAAVINGVVTTMAGPRKEKWDSGVFEFVVAYIQAGPDAVTGLDPNVPWVRDKAYKFTFYKQAHGY
jgi:hypothetical protein